MFVLETDLLLLAFAVKMSDGWLSMVGLQTGSSILWLLTSRQN